MSLDDAMLRLRPRLARHRAYQAVFATPEGQMVLRDLLREGGVLTTTHEPGDPCSTAWNEGKRVLALYVVQQLRWTEAELLALATTQSPTRETEDA